MKKVRYTVEVEGHQRRLISAQQENDGTITLGLGLTSGIDFAQNGPHIRHQKYSVHRSSTSLEFNLIKHTLELTDGRKITTCASNGCHKISDGLLTDFQRAVPRSQIAEVQTSTE